MGQYMGSGSATAGNTVDIGFEPSYVMIKRSGGTGSWAVFDVMRGIVSAGDDPVLQPDVNDAEYTTTQYLDLTPRGFRLKGSFNQTNADENGYVYVAIRRPDGYVGKPPELGTGVFAMDTQISNGSPMYISNFVVDYALHRDPTHSGTWEGDWYSVSRLQGPDTLITNGTGSEQSGTWQHWDYNNGFGKNGSTSYTDWQAWMWKRHAGFDVVTWTGDGVTGRQIPHSMGKTPEMMWVKRRSNTEDWTVYHLSLIHI